MYIKCKFSQIYSKTTVINLHFISCPLTHISMASFLWDIGKQNSLRCDAAKRGVPSEAILISSKKKIKMKNYSRCPLKWKWTRPNDEHGKVHSSQVG